MMQLILSHHLSLTFCWAFPLPQHVKSAFIAMCASGFRPVIQTHGKMPKFTWRILTEFESTWNFALVQRAFLFTAWSLSRFLPLAVRLFCLRMGCRRRRSSFFVSDHCHCCQKLSCHDWEYMSLLWNIIHVPSTENTFPLSSQRRLSFLSDAWSPFHNIVPDPEVSILIIWSIWSFTAVFNCWKFGFLFFVDSWSYKANTVWSWTEFCNFDLHNPSRITSEGISLTDCSAWSHLTSKSCVVIQ